MSKRPQNLSPDLQRLRDEGYEVAIRGSQVVLTSIPYVTSEKTVKLGALITPFNGNTTAAAVPPLTHQAYFAGEAPCNSNGLRIEQIYHSTEHKDYGNGLASDHGFSAKVDGIFPDSYHTLFHTYLGHICPPATAIDPHANPRTHRVKESYDDNDVFEYSDTNAARARIDGSSVHFHGQKVAIVGCGGTGSYLLDFISKTPVDEIHLFDFDVFQQHNAFRCPGAASKAIFGNAPGKVDYLRGVYSNMHKGIHAHRELVNESTVSQLDGMSFVFVAIDKPECKGPIVAYLEGKGISFIDVGMGMEEYDGKISGQLRSTLSAPENRACFRERVSMAPDKDGIYNTNIQIAELNALNAAMAVVKWKKVSGFYLDQRVEFNSVYSVSDQVLAKAPANE